MLGGAGSLVPDGRHVVCFSSRLHRDFCFASSGVDFCVDCIGILCLCDLVWFVLQTVSAFSFLRRLVCVQQHELRYADVICVGMCFFVWRDTSGCLAVFSRSRPGITFISVAGVRLCR